MYKPPGAKQAVDHEGTGIIDVTIEPNGQLIFSGGFHGKSNLISSNKDTYFEVHWLEETQQIIISFADESQMKEVDENFVAPKTKVERNALRKQGIFILQSDNLKLGLMNVLRDGCTKTIIPDTGHRTKFRENDDLFIGVDEETGSKYITLNTLDKKPEPSKSTKKYRKMELKLAKWCKQFMEKPDEFRRTIFKDKDWNEEWQEVFWRMVNRIDNPIERPKPIVNRKSEEEVQMWRDSHPESVREQIDSQMKASKK